MEYLTYIFNSTPKYKMNRLPVEVGHTFLECLPRCHFLFMVSFSLLCSRLVFYTSLDVLSEK